eukprot:GHVU01073917.1.p1 GENE.GHVU01073917.1~~GHVU01073917.1.p1  ORF type:complete len:173 (+),score=10.64 GHVU01073917.1:623-1141(+)
MKMSMMEPDGHMSDPNSKSLLLKIIAAMRQRKALLEGNATVVDQAKNVSEAHIEDALDPASAIADELDPPRDYTSVACPEHFMMASTDCFATDRYKVSDCRYVSPTRRRGGPGPLLSGLETRVRHGCSLGGAFPTHKVAPRCAKLLYVRACYRRRKAELMVWRPISTLPRAD